ncbi:MAG: hypothetical protein AB1414_07975 [bacterium]
MKKITPLLILLFFSWIIAVLFLYFKVHYSYLALFLSKNNIFDELYLLFILALLSYASGRRIFLLTNIKFSSFLEEFIFANGVGWIILACGVMIGKIALLILLLFFVIELFPIIRIILNKIKCLFGIKPAGLNIILWFLLGITIFFTFLMALTPSFISFNFIFPIGFKLIYFYFGILIIMTIFALTRRHFNQNCGLLASCIFYINSLWIFPFERTTIEFVVIFYGLLAVYLLLKWNQTLKDGYFKFIFRCLILLVLFPIFISHLIYRYSGEYTLLRRVILCVITGVFILILGYESYIIFNYAPLKFIFGLETASEYLARIASVLK